MGKYNDFESVMERSAQKINFSRATLMGSKNRPVRDLQGFSFTANRILKSIENQFDSGVSSKFLLNEALVEGIKQNFSRNKKNFSASDLGSVVDVDVADISIAATVASHGLTYVAMERAMDSVGQNISFQGLKALNTAAGFIAGEKVLDPRKALNPKLDISRNGARTTTNFDAKDIAAAETDISIPLSPAGPVVTGETKVSIILTANLATGTPTLIAFATGKDLVGTSESLVLTKGGFVDNPKIDISTGEFTATSLIDLSTYTIIVSRVYDRIAETDGANTLKLKPYMESTEIVATENRIILQSSVEVQAQMNKILRQNASYGINVDFGKRAIDQIVTLYTYFIDTNIFRQLWAGIQGTSKYGTLDLSLFNSGDFKSFAATKNDRLSLFLRSMESAFLTKTGSPITALLVDQTAALMIANDSENFVRDPAFLQRRDGYIGDYQGIPVVRNAYLNGKATVVGNGLVIGVYKSLDGQAAPVAQGDYLPPYSTIPAINATNPGELAQALFSQTAVKCVVPEWAIWGEIKPYTI